MAHPHPALTDFDRMLAHWLEVVPEHLLFAARYGQWTWKHDLLDYRLGTYGMGRN